MKPLMMCVVAWSETPAEIVDLSTQRLQTTMVMMGESFGCSRHQDLLEVPQLAPPQQAYSSRAGPFQKLPDLALVFAFAFALLLPGADASAKCPSA